MAIRIFTDATADLTAEYCREHGIFVFPMPVTVGDRSFVFNGVDRFEGDMDIQEFYAGMRTGNMPSTAQVTPETYRSAFEDALLAGDEVLYLAFSSGLSGSYNGSCLAVQQVLEDHPEFEGRIAVVDTLSASLGEGLLVELVRREMEKGKSLAELAAYAEENRQSCHHWFTVDDLFHLKRGGRVSAVAAVFGTMLAIKPVLQVDAEGHLIPKEKTQGRQKSLRALVEHMAQECEDPANSPIFISHGDCMEDVQTVEKLLQKKFGRSADMVNCIGPVVAAHAGPGTLAIFFVSKKPR